MTAQRGIAWVLDVFVTTGIVVFCVFALCFAGAATAMLWGYEQITGVVGAMTIVVVLATCMRRLARIMQRGAS